MKYIAFILSLCVCIAAAPAFASESDGADKNKRKQTESSKQNAENKKDTGTKDTQDKSTKYTGKPGNFIFYNADLKNVLLFFARTYKLNIVIDPGVSGKVTCRLIDVPWDQALDLILKQNDMMLLKERKGKTLSLQKIGK